MDGRISNNNIFRQSILLVYFNCLVHSMGIIIRTRRELGINMHPRKPCAKCGKLCVGIRLCRQCFEVKNGHGLTNTRRRRLNNG